MIISSLFRTLSSNSTLVTISFAVTATLQQVALLGFWSVCPVAAQCSWVTCFATEPPVSCSENSVDLTSTCKLFWIASFGSYTGCALGEAVFSFISQRIRWRRTSWIGCIWRGCLGLNQSNNGQGDKSSQ